MAEEIIDALVLQARFDSEGLAQDAREGVSAAIQDIAKSIKQGQQELGIDVNLDPFIQSLKKLDAPLKEVFIGMRLGLEAASEAFGKGSQEAEALERTLRKVIAAEQELEKAQAISLRTGPVTPGRPGPAGVVQSVPPIELGDTSARFIQVKKAAEGVGLAVSDMAKKMALATDASIRAADAQELWSRVTRASVGDAKALTTLLAAASSSLDPFIAKMNEAASTTETFAARTRDAGPAAVHPMAQAMSEAAGASQQMILGMTAAAEALESFEARSRDARAGVSQLHKQFGQVAKGAGSAEAGIARLRSGMVQLAVIAGGTTSPVGQLATGLLFIAGLDSLPIVALAGTVLGLVKAYEALNHAAIEAKKTNKELLEGLKARTRLPLGETTEEAERRVGEAKLIELLAKEERLRKAIHEFSVTSVLQGPAILRFRLQLAMNEQLEIERGLRRVSFEEQMRQHQRLREFQVAEVQREQELQAIRAQGAEAALSAQLKIAQTAGTETFVEQPQGLSDQVLQSFRDRLILTQQTNNAQTKSLQIQLEFARKAAAATGITQREREERQKVVDQLESQLAIQRELNSQRIHGIVDEQTLEQIQRLKDIEEASADALVQRVAREKRLRQILAQGVQTEIAARLKLAQVGTKETFREQPQVGGLSDQVLQSFRERLALAQANQRADEKGLQVLIAQARQQASQKGISEDERIRRQQKLDDLLTELAITKEMGRQEIRAIRTEQAVAGVAALTEAEKAAVQSQDELTAAYNQFWDDIEAKSNLAIGKVIDRLKDLQKNQRELAADKATASIEHFFDVTKDAVDRLVTPADQAAEAVLRLQFNLAKLDTVVGIVADVGHELGLLGQDSLRALGSVQNLIRGFGAFKDAQEQVATATNAIDKLMAKIGEVGALGGIVGAAAGLIGSIGSLFGGGGGPSDQKLANDLLRDNTARLADLRDSLDRGLQTLAGITEARAETAKLQGLAPGATDRLSAAQAQAFRDELAKSGLTVEAWAARISRLTGIDVLDEKGHLVAASLDQVDEALAQLAKDATSFGNSFQEQQQALDLRARLAGEAQDPTTSFARAIDAIDAFSPAIKDALGNIDLGDPEAVRKRLLELFDEFKSGFFTAHPELFGDISKEDFLDFLGQGADYLESFNDALNKNITDLNLPQGFRRAALLAQTADFVPTIPDTAATDAQNKEARFADLLDDGATSLDGFNTALEDLIANLIPLGATTPTPTTQALPPTAAPLPAPQAPGAQFGNRVLTFTVGDIVVNESKTPKATAEQILTELRKLALAQTGDTLQINMN